MKYIPGKESSRFSHHECGPVNSLWKSFLKVESSIARCRAVLQEKHLTASHQAGVLPFFSNSTFIYINEMKLKTDQIKVHLNLLEETLKRVQKISIDRYSVDEVTQKDHEYIVELERDLQFGEISW